LSTAWSIALAADDRLSILVFGAGAIGGYLGGSLALQGHRVVFLERPHSVPLLRQHGLQLQLGERHHHLTNLEVSSSIEDVLKLASFNLALFALKSYDTAKALKALVPVAGSLPPFLCLQNGVENETTLEAFLGAGRVMAAAMNAADLNARLYPDASSMKWSKLLTNLLTNATCAILDLSPAEVMTHSGLFALEMRQLREALAVLRALRLPVVDLPGTPVRALAFGTRLPVALARPLMARAVGRGRGAKLPSLHIDLHSGKGRSEVDWLNGAVVRAGHRVGVATPVNKILNETLLGMLAGDQPVSDFRHDPAKLLAALER